jgi:peptide chain release factor 2
MRSGGGFDLENKQARAAELEAETAAGDFWDDPQTAQKKMQEMSALREVVEAWDGIIRRAHDAHELYAMVEDDPAMLGEIEAEAGALEAEIDRREFELALSGKYDRGPALFSIHAGAGGTEAQDWAADAAAHVHCAGPTSHGYREALPSTDMTEGDEAGHQDRRPSAVDGPNAYGLAQEQRSGAHRLVRISALRLQQHGATPVLRPRSR